MPLCKLLPVLALLELFQHFRVGAGAVLKSLFVAFRSHRFPKRLHAKFYLNINIIMPPNPKRKLVRKTKIGVPDYRRKKRSKVLKDALATIDRPAKAKTYMEKAKQVDRQME